MIVYFAFGIATRNEPRNARPLSFEIKPAIWKTCCLKAYQLNILSLSLYSQANYFLFILKRLVLMPSASFFPRIHHLWIRCINSKYGFLFGVIGYFHFHFIYIIAGAHYLKALWLLVCFLATFILLLSHCLVILFYYGKKITWNLKPALEPPMFRWKAWVCTELLDMTVLRRFLCELGHTWCPVKYPLLPPSSNPLIMCLGYSLLRLM